MTNQELEWALNVVELHESRSTQPGELRRLNASHEELRDVVNHPGYGYGAVLRELINMKQASECLTCDNAAK